MYGPATPTPTRALLARIAFASFPLWSLGLLSWVPSLRFAVLRRRPYDWAVFALACVLTVVYIVLLVKVPETKPGEEGNAQLVAGIYIILLIGGAVVHALLGDRPRRAPAPGPGPVPGAGPVPGPGPVPYPGGAAHTAAPGPAAGPYGPPQPPAATPGPAGPAPTPGQLAGHGPAPGRPAGPAPAMGPVGPVPGMSPTGPSGPAPTMNPTGPAAPVPSADPYGAPGPYAPTAPAGSAPPPASPRMRQVASELAELGEALRRQGDGRQGDGRQDAAPHDPRRRPGQSSRPGQPGQWGPA
ncbi:hypothetical protein [Streptomyces albus]|uniref:hypothetical protein n=1 Tax=Streptomyces albus TaxID=1888 RepID=UPI003F1C7C10